MAGASQPPFRIEESRIDPLHAPATSQVERKASGPPAELAESLSIPQGSSPEPPAPDALPRTIAEARGFFTHLSRELGRKYRIVYGIELRTDVNALEAMQARLFESYNGQKLRSLDDWLDVRRHGALLSEILARTLGAQWSDIAQDELGYWSMMIPPGTRIWPFARVLRFLAMGPKERDLVSYYLELKDHARAW
jgi:hypothetical protein